MSVETTPRHFRVIALRKVLEEALRADPVAGTRSDSDTFYVDDSDIERAADAALTYLGDPPTPESRYGPPARYCGSDGASGAHCDACWRDGHVVAHPGLGCVDVGCVQTHGTAWAGGSGLIEAGR